jgi:fibronectin-binding autotransporter adhesin
MRGSLRASLVSKSKFTLAAIAVFCSSLLASDARSATKTWNGLGGDDFWNTGANWGGTAPVAADALVFDGTTRLTPNNNIAANTSFAGITFNSIAGAFTLSGNAVLLGGDITDNSTNAQTISLSLLLDGGTRNINVVSGGSLSLGSVTFGLAALSANTSTLNVNSNISATSLTARTNSANANTIVIASGKALTVNGNVFVRDETAGNGHKTNLTVTGSGSTLAIGSSGGTFVVGEISNTANSTTSMATMDLSGLSTFTANYGATGKIGVGTTNTVTAGNGPNGTLILGGNNTLTAGTMYVGYGATNAGTNTLRLGTTNSINVDNLTVAGGKGPGTMNFNTGLTNPTLVLRGSGGGANRVTNWKIADYSDYASGGASTASTGTVNFTAAGTGSGTDGTVDALVTNLIIGTGRITLQDGGTGTCVGTLTFDKGTIDATSVVLGKQSTGTAAGATATGTLNVNGTASLVVGTGGITLGSGTNGTATFTGNLNINAGTVTMVGVGANINDGGATSNVTLNGGTLDMGGNNIGSGASPIDNITIQTGTLKNIGEINGGATLTKGVAGTLTLAGTNTYTGNTTVNLGTLVVSGTNSGNGGFTVNGGASASLAGTLLVTGAIMGTGAINVNGNTFGGTLTGTGNGTTTGKLLGDVNLASGSNLRPGAAAADGQVGTLVMNNVNFSGDYRFDITSGSSNDLVIANGIATFNSGSTLTPGTVNVTSGTYTLVSSPNAINYSGTPAIGAGSTRTVYTLNTNTNSLTVTVSGSPKTIYWTSADGTGPGTWDLINKTNWTDLSITEKYYNLDSVVFNDAQNTGGVRNIQLDFNAIPGSVTVDNSSGNYTFQGSGSINGTGALTKSGTSALTISTTAANTYSGGTVLNNGALNANVNGALGTGPVTVNGGTLNLGNTSAMGASPLTLNGGAIDNTTGSAFALPNNNAQAWGSGFTFVGTSDLDLGTGAISLNGASTTTVTVSAGKLTATGAISNGTGNSLAKNGPGTLVVGITQTTTTGVPAANTYSGGTTITAGKLQVGSFGALGTGDITISGTGTLDLSLMSTNAANIAGGFGSRTVTISGTGAGGIGAIYSDGSATGNAGQQQNAFSKITLAGNATIGGVGVVGNNANPGRYDLRNNTPTLDLAGFTLTKTGTNIFDITTTTLVTLGDIVLTSPASTTSTDPRNILAIEATASVLAGLKPDNVTPYTITFNNFTGLQLFNLTSTNVTRQMVMNGDVLLANNSTTTQPSTLVAPITLNSGSTLRVDRSQNGLVSTDITLTGLIDGSRTNHQAEFSQSDPERRQHL